jgi:predicted nucleic acid-binding protein
MLTLDANVWIAVFDPRDALHHPSMIFLAEVAERRLGLVGPAFVLVEISCAIARRLQNAAGGKAAIQQLRKHPALTLLPMTEKMLALAGDLGAHQLIRGADALYVAASSLTGAPLISWDAELVRRAGALTPQDWLAANPR